LAYVTRSSDTHSKEGSGGREAQKSNIQAVRNIAEVIKLTIGPGGMGKTLVASLDGVTMIKDEVTILRD
jgi:chaperonin GroEL (HSP60 family)